MPVSGSIDFKLSGAEIVLEARRKAGIHADEEPLEAYELVNGLTALNMMFKAWQADGVSAGDEEDGAITLVQGQITYTVTPVPFEVETARITRGGGNEIPMCRLSREDYLDFPNKTTQGYPTQFYYRRNRDGGTIYVWPAPDAGLGTINYSYRRVINDMDISANDIDLPQEWYEAIVYNLADRFMENFSRTGTPEAKKIAQKAAMLYATVKGFSTGEVGGSIMIAPYGFER